MEMSIAEMDRLMNAAREDGYRQGRAERDTLLAALMAIRDVPANIDNSEFRRYATAIARAAIDKAKGENI